MPWHKQRDITQRRRERMTARRETKRSQKKRAFIIASLAFSVFEEEELKLLVMQCLALLQQTKKFYQPIFSIFVHLKCCQRAVWFMTKVVY